MTETEAPFKFQWMNLDIEFYRNDKGEWWCRVMDEDTAGSGATAIWSEQPLSMAMETFGMITVIGNLLLAAEREHGGTAESMGVNPR